MTNDERLQCCDCVCDIPVLLGDDDEEREAMFVTDIVSVII